MVRSSTRRDVDYVRMTKMGVITGVCMFLIGAGAEIWIHTRGIQSPTLEPIFLAMEFLGPIVVVLSIVIFVIILPLTE